MSITEAEFFQRVNSFKEHAPLHFDDMKTFSQIEKMYEDMLEEECHSQLLLVTTSEIPGSGNGLFTVAESTLRGRRFGYKGNFLRSSNAHELSAYFKKELLSMKSNTQELDSTDNAAVETYFENRNALKVKNWELSSEQIDATKDLFTRVAAENCFGKNLLTYAKFTELLPVSSFLKLEHNAVDIKVLKVLSYVLTAIYLSLIHI